MKKTNRILAFCISLLLIITMSGCSLQGTKKSEQQSQKTERSYTQDSAASKTKQAKQEQKRFDDWCEEQFVDTMKHAGTLNIHYMLEKPEAYGVKEKKEEVSYGTLSVAQMKRDEKENEICEKELKKMDRSLLTKEQKLTYDIISYTLEQQKGAKGFELYTSLLSPNLGIPANLPVELAEYPLQNKKDVETYLVLLTKTPEYFKQLIEFEKEVSKQGLFISDDTLKETMAGIRDFINEPEQNYLITTFGERIKGLSDVSKEDCNAFVKQNTKYVNQYVIKAYQDLLKELESLKGTGKNTGGICHFPNGKEYYEYLVKANTCSDMTVDEVWDIVSKRLQNRYRKIQRLAQKNADIFDAYDSISYNTGSPMETLAYLQKKMEAYYPDCPAVNYTVKHVDASLAETLSPAFYMVPQIDNDKNNTIYINDKNSHFNSKDLYSILAHEGFPGHMFQTIYYNSTNPNPIRQMLDFGGYSEGWATYVELSSYELYNYGNKDEELTQMCQIDNEFSLAVSTLADIGVNAKGWDKKRLKKFLTNYSMGDDETVNQVYQLVVDDPANYLKYYVSFLEFFNLRCKYKAQHNSNFTIRDFHEKVLNCGPAPFPILEKYVME